MDIDAPMLVVFSVITSMVKSAFAESVFHGRGAVYVTDYQLGVGVGVIYRPQHYLQYSGGDYEAYLSFYSNLDSNETHLSYHKSRDRGGKMSWDSTGRYYYYLQYESRVDPNTLFGYSIWIYRNQSVVVYEDMNNFYEVPSTVKYCVIDSSSTPLSYNCSQALKDSTRFPQTTTGQVSQSTVSQSTKLQSTVSQPTVSQSTVSPSTVPQSPVSPSTASQSTVSSSIVPQSPVSPSIVQQSPVSPSIVPQSPVSSSIVPQSPVSPSIVQQSPVSLSTAPQSTVLPSTASHSTVPQSTVSQSTVSLSTVSQPTVSQSTVLQSSSSTSYEVHQQTEELKKYEQSFDFAIAFPSVCGAVVGIIIIIIIIIYCKHRCSKKRNTEIRCNTVTREEIELSNFPLPTAPPAETERPAANNDPPPSYQTALTLEMTYTNVGGSRHISNRPPPPSYQHLCLNCHSVRNSAVCRRNCPPTRSSLG